MMVSGTFSELLAPGLRKVFNRAYTEVPEVWTQLFNSNRTDRAWEEDFSWAGFEPFQPFDELEDIQLRNAKPGYKVRYVMRKWGLGYQLSRELIEDNLYSGVVEAFPSHLARAARHTKETVAASVFNLGFSGSQPGGDAKPLFATDHPLLGAASGTVSNTFGSSRALSHTALKDALVALKRNKADDGTFSPVTPSILLVPDALAFTAQEILGTDKVPYSADNTTNVLTSQGLQVVSWSFLTDDDNWFLLAPKAQTALNYFERWPMTQVMKDNEINQSMVHAASERYGFGFSDFVGTFGVQGV